MSGGLFVVDIRYHTAITSLLILSAMKGVSPERVYGAIMLINSNEETLVRTGSKGIEVPF